MYLNDFQEEQNHSYFSNCRKIFQNCQEKFIDLTFLENDKGDNAEELKKSAK